MRRLPEGVEQALIAINDGAHTPLDVALVLEIPLHEAKARLSVLVDYGLIEREEDAQRELRERDV